MRPRIFLACCTLLIGFGSLVTCQRHQKQKGEDDYTNDFRDDLPEEGDGDLIPAASRNSGKRSKNKKHSDSDSDSYHVVYESKPESYSTSYHHSDKTRHAPKDRTYGTSSNGRSGGGGSSSYDSPYSSGSSNSNRRQSKNNRNNNDDYDDYGDSPRQQSRSKPKTAYDDADYDYDDDTRSGKGYDHTEEFDRSQKDDYHKSGELKDDFADFGREGNDAHRSGGGSGGRGSRQRDSYSNSDRERSDSDYDDEGFSRSLDGPVGQGDREDNPLDRYEQKTRKALREYGGDDGKSFLSARHRKK